MSLLRRLLKSLHPEGIPWPGSVIYSRLSGSGIFQRHYELVAKDVLSYCSAGSLLDVGTGPGWLLVKIHRMNPGIRLVGVDISAAMVSSALANIRAAGCSAAVDIREASAARLPFEDGSFDAVVSTGSLHHWKEAVAGLDESHRVLKTGGHALIYDLVKHTPGEVFDAAARDFGRLRMTLLWLHSFEEPFYDPQDMRVLAGSTRFKEGRTKFVGALCCLILRKTA